VGRHGTVPVIARERDPFGRGYWDAIAATWDDEVFDTLAHDRHGVIVRELRQLARSSKRVADFGCGVGKYLPVLSALFQDVHGFDQSPVCIGHARVRVRGRSNVTLHVGLAAGCRHVAAFDAAVCVNAAIHPARARWQHVLREASRLVGQGGSLLTVVPAFESALLIQRLQGGAGDYCAHPGVDGVVDIQGVPTKHFRRAELGAVLLALGASSNRIVHVEYSWRSVGIAAPGTVQLPWDWMAISKFHRPRLPAPVTRRGRGRR
jgi:SAM-dependent methyltransferase